MDKDFVFKGNEVMRHTFSRLLLVLMIFSFSSGVFAQTTSFKAAYDSLNIGAQFDFLFKKANRYQEYKVMNIVGYNLLKQNALDSIEVYSQEISQHKKTINTLNGQIKLNDIKIDSLTTALSETKRQQNSMSLIGIDVSKEAYNSIMWGIVVCLIIVAAIIFFLFKRGHSVVKSTKKRLDEVQDEFEKHRKNALVREQKLARELMDFKIKHGSNRI